MEKEELLSAITQENAVSAVKFVTMNVHVLWKSAMLKKITAKVVAQAFTS